MLFSARFKAILECSGIEILLTAYRAPNMNAFAERFVRSINSECLSQIVFVRQASLDRAIAEYVAHYHDERSHQGIGNEIVSGTAPQRVGEIEVSERLGGLLNYYHRRAALWPRSSIRTLRAWSGVSRTCRFPGLRPYNRNSIDGSPGI
ncbi:hypothetical protein DRQ53_13765 [bacterium]|nr:MAG: hypothetical protein DRQ53_13765 [bacterium]